MNSVIQKTNLAGVLIINQPIFPDDRGFFHETFRKNELEKITGKPFEIVQQNHSRSGKFTLRGIHAAPWSKLIYVPRGVVQEVVVDLRKSSPTFGKWISVFLGDDTKSALFLPPDCGNAFLVISSEADYIYLVSDYWTAGSEYGLIWNDQDLNIKWQTSSPILSEKDQKNITFKEKFSDR